MRRAREPEGKGPTRLLNVCVESFLIGFLVLLLRRIDLINPPKPSPEGESNGGATSFPDRSERLPRICRGLDNIHNLAREPEAMALPTLPSRSRIHR